MAFGDEIRGELFKKIGTDSITDPIEKLKFADKELEAGNHAKAKEIIQSVIELTGANSKRYEEQKQHRSAAESYFIQGLAYEKLEATDKRDENYAKVTNELLAASKNAFNFGEDNRGITSVTLAGLVCLMFGDEGQALQIYNDGMKLTEQKQDVDTLKKLLYSLGYLLDALRNTNAGALTDAQNYISTDLKPMLTTSKLLGFTTLLETIVIHTRRIIESRIKMPKIQLGSQIPRDMLFNSTYEILINIANAGEGEATDVGYNLQIPEEIEVLDGNVNEEIGDLLPQTNIERIISIRLLSGERTAEIVHELTGYVTYNDMLQNSHKQSLGILSLEFRAVSKASEYTEKLESALLSFNKIEDIRNKAIPESFHTAIKKLFETFENEVVNIIKAEEFEVADFGISIIENLNIWAKEVIGDGEIASTMIEDLNKQINEATDKLSEELANKYNEEKETVLSTLRTELNSEKDKEFTELRSNIAKEKEDAIKENTTLLESKFNEERTTMRDDHDIAIKEKQQVSENKLRQQITQLESKLKDEHNVEIQRKNDEVEKAIREIQNQQLEEIAKAKEDTRKEVTNKYEDQIEKLNSDFSEEKRKLKDATNEAKESELKTTRSKLNQEKQESLDTQLRELTLKHEQELDEKIDNLNTIHTHQIKEKDAKIQELESKLRDFKSSVQPLD